jgi:hypothetical protein
MVGCGGPLAARPNVVYSRGSRANIAVGASSLLNSGRPCSFSAEQGRPEHILVQNLFLSNKFNPRNQSIMFLSNDF